MRRDFDIAEIEGVYHPLPRRLRPTWLTPEMTMLVIVVLSIIALTVTLVGMRGI